MIMAWLRHTAMDATEARNMILSVVEQAAQAGRMLSPSHEANRILEAYPDCSVPFDVLRHDLIRAATSRGVPLSTLFEASVLFRRGAPKEFAL